MGLDNSKGHMHKTIIALACGLPVRVEVEKYHFTLCNRRQ